ncbi:hypothetical protein FTUN_8755 [Frigoriglobus tundricola]|uniref:Uncharacterized protein n=2 Tax=Frigoriglobus tundricola TaxID=2774151 RepID=A0A6M5Z4Y5_9BACT|nr:hypothetical protein FTUN_8755 [Frigoriglobus tundricola]
MSTNKPVHEIRFGRIRAAVWENAGVKGVMHSVTFSRLYKDEKTDQWADSTSFGRDDLLLLAKVTDLAHTWVLEQQAPNRTAPTEE